jgi:hypothetical protein
MNSILRLIFICVVVFLYPYKDFGQKVKENSDLRHWPTGSSPQEIGKRNVGDLHGQAPILWCASALLR